jgi:dihydrofolate reductase
VAFDSQYGIGKNGGLAWRLPGDLKHFKEVTAAVTNPGRKNAVIMGRKTWESLPEKFRPLPGRVNVVLSQQSLSLSPGVICAHSLDGALTQLSLANIENIFVIGGAQIYAQALEHPSCHKLYVTHVQGTFGCDAFFPPISPRFMLLSSSETYQEGGISFNFCAYWRS